MSYLGFVNLQIYGFPLIQFRRFIIRRLDQFTENCGAPFVTNSQIFGNAMRSQISLIPLVFPKDHLGLSLNNN